MNACGSGAQLEPWHLSHWYLNAVGLLAQIPGVAVSSRFGSALPVIVGGLTLAGRAATFSVVPVVRALEVPLEFVALIVTSSVEPMSSRVGVYASLVASVIAEQVPPATGHRDHW
jgi:hypothetical protein